MWLVRYDSATRFASRYGQARVVEASSADEAMARVCAYEDGWTVTVLTCRPATQTERDYQTWVDLWMTRQRQG